MLHFHLTLGESEMVSLGGIIVQLNQVRSDFALVELNINNKKVTRGFPGGAVVKNPPANAGDTGLSPGPGRSHMPQSN